MVTEREAIQKKPGGEPSIGKNRSAGVSHGPKQKQQECQKKQTKERTCERPDYPQGETEIDV